MLPTTRQDHAADALLHEAWKLGRALAKRGMTDAECNREIACYAVATVRALCGELGSLDIDRTVPLMQKLIRTELQKRGI
jgi:hypothetical protein